jgi:hypothetical protein
MNIFKLVCENPFSEVQTARKRQIGIRNGCCCNFLHASRARGFRGISGVLKRNDLPNYARVCELAEGSVRQGKQRDRKIFEATFSPHRIIGVHNAGAWHFGTNTRGRASAD